MGLPALPPTTSRRSGPATMGSGSSRSQVLTSLLKCFETPRASRLLATHVLVEVGLGEGVEAGWGSREGRSGVGRVRGLAGGWSGRPPGRRRSRRCGWVYRSHLRRAGCRGSSRSRSRRGLVGHRAPGSEAFWDHPRRVVGCLDRWCQLETRSGFTPTSYKSRFTDVETGESERRTVENQSGQVTSRFLIGHLVFATPPYITISVKVFVALKISLNSPHD
jgi:hypothetical protein